MTNVLLNLGYMKSQVTVFGHFMMKYVNTTMNWESVPHLEINKKIIEMKFDDSHLR